jgi:hypothetical protein
MPSKLPLLVVPAALAIGVIAACSDDEATDATTGTGTPSGTASGLPACASVEPMPSCVECLTPAGDKDCAGGNEDVFCLYDPENDRCDEAIA